MRYILLFCCLTLMACQKEALQHEADIKLIDNYIAANPPNIAWSKDAAAAFYYGFFVQDPSDTTSPARNAGQTIEVKFEAYLLHPSLDTTFIYDSIDTLQLMDINTVIDTLIQGIDTTFTSRLDTTNRRDSITYTHSIALDDAIYGWQLGIPKMTVKDSMLLILPSRLAYGEAGHTASGIPPNSVLIFYIKLEGFSP